MKKLILTFIPPLFISGIGLSQDHFNCGTQQSMNTMWTQNPQLKKEWKNTFLANLNKDSDDSTVFIIPIVFHILHENGYENISDAQVLSAVDILNRDFRLLNSDTSNVIQDFKHLYGDAKIEFRLAKLDPYGNCTNGIERIYTHLTNSADDYSKINQWYRPNYLNIWVVKSIGQAGVAGYSYFPNTTNGSTASRLDGVIMLHNYIGNIGTGSTSTSRTILHEIAHYLNLPHLNAVPVSGSENCGDDGIEDTPITEGYLFCNQVGPWDYCVPGINENFQNFMEFSYCTLMFTKGQVTHMRNSLQNIHGQRNELTTPESHAATGINQINPIPCVPIGEFYATNTQPCVGGTVNFKDASWNAPITSYQWTFQDGSPSTSTAQNPSISFTSPGFKVVTLTVTNGSGTHTVEKSQYIRVSDNWADYTGSTSIDLNSEDSHPEWFHIENPEDNWARFSYSPLNGKNGGGCFKLNNYKNIAGVPSTHPDYFYNQQLGEAKDYLVTPSFDLRYTSNATLSFDYAYATNTQSITEITESIQISYSINCGASWIQTGGSGLNGLNLVSHYASYNEFVPTDETQWKNFQINVPNPAYNAAKTMFRIRFSASDYSNNFYIDNINIQGTGFASLNDFSIINDLTLSPNPLISGNSLKVEYTATNEPVTFTLRNLHGTELFRTVKNETNQLVSFDLDMGNKLPASYYFLEVKSASATTVKKIVVVKQ